MTNCTVGITGLQRERERERERTEERVCVCVWGPRAAVWVWVCEYLCVCCRLAHEGALLLLHGRWGFTRRWEGQFGVIWSSRERRLHCERLKCQRPIRTRHLLHTISHHVVNQCPRQLYKMDLTGTNLTWNKWVIWRSLKLEYFYIDNGLRYYLYLKGISRSDEPKENFHCSFSQLYVAL